MRKKRQINRILTSMILSMVALNALSQVKGEKPTLVVGIIVDQLRSDYIELLQSHFGTEGFNKLTSEGAYFENVNFSIPKLDKVSGTSIVFTGNYPNINGIPSAKVFDTKTRRERDILTDASKIGNFTSETLSPQAITVSTLSDEVRVNSEGLGYVYSIAPDAQQAIIMAGHAGNSAVWINDVTGNWASSTFYKDYPMSMQMRNYSNSIAKRLDTATWKPSLDLSAYPDIPTHRKFYPFRYVFKRSNKDRYNAFKESALVNEEVTSVAIDHIKSQNLGRRGQLDMINIAYTAAPYSYSIDQDYRIELQDTYIRLDKQLARLFNAIEKQVGKNKAVIFLSSTGYFTDDRCDDEKFNIPTGKFYIDRAKSLLNMYLMSIYGNGNWVYGYDQNQFFLNHDLIKERNKDLAEIRDKSAKFLRQMSGVSETYTIEDILNNPVSEHAQAINKGTTAIYAGDIFVRILPGWQIVNDDLQKSNKIIRTNAVNTPAFILAPGINSQKIPQIVDASFLAPTVARILRIRSPNAATHKPLSL